MPVNTASVSRQPRGLMKVNGVVMPNWLDWEVDNNTHYQADTFRASISLSAAPSGYGAAWWSAQPKLTVEIFAGFPANPASYSAADLDSIFYGKVDDLGPFKPASNRIEISGRDLTAEMIDTKTSEKYANLTSSQIAATIAAAHGLTPVITATTTKVGRYYQIDRTRMQDDRTEWDLLTWLAREESFDVFVKGQSLYFQPKANGSNPYPFAYTAPTNSNTVPQFAGTDLTFTRNLSLAKDITVTVRSWNAKQKKAFTKTAKSTHTKSKVLKGATEPVYDTQNYSYVIAGLTPEQAQQRANQLLAELSIHEKKCYIEGPAQNDLSVTDVISVSGTGTDFDQTYYPDSIIRSMSLEGYRWTITAKNHPPESEPSV